MADDPAILRCSECGRPIAPGAPCAACLLRLGSAAEAPLPLDEPSRWRLLSVLGGSANGSTYLAEAEGAGARHEPVVFKLIDLHVGGPEAEGHLRAAQRRVAAAALPAAAAMLDAGVTDTGQPYVVFEHVRGRPILSYLTRHGVPRDARQALMAEVTEAVRQAHRAGIVHGALDASRVLVAPDGGRLRPRLIDFGLLHVLAALDEPSSRPLDASEDLKALEALEAEILRM